MKKKLSSTLLALCMLLALLPGTAGAVDYPTSGPCGENATWSYDATTKTLTISGSGEVVYSLGAEDIDSVHYQARREAEKIIFDGEFTAIGGFYEFSNIKEISVPDGVKYIASSAFSGCSKLIHVSIPASVIRMGTYGDAYTVFSGCTNLTEITVAPQNAEYSSQDGALFTKEKGTILFCPQGKTAYTIPDSVNIVKDFAFSGCTKLTTVTIPGSVNDIGFFAFNDCASLTNITLPDGVKSLSGSFSGCSNLETVHLPASLTAIGSGTFYKCPLKSIIYSGSEMQWGAIKIDSENAELSYAKITFLNPSVPSTPNKPATPGTLTVSAPTSGGLGRQVTIQVPGGHWLTVQTRRAGSISLTSLQAPANTSGMSSVTVSASAGSVLQIWETATQMQFSNGVPTTPILNTAVRQL